MQIVDLTEQHEELFCLCLEEWSEQMKESGDHKACWCREFAAKGFRAKLALDDTGEVGGMIQYLPIEESPAEGRDLHFVLCIWVHGHKQGRGNFQRQGMGKALLHAAEEDARALGAKGVAAWGLWIPVWMKASWFKRQGYRKVDRDGIRVLVWKPFQDDARPPKWIRQRKTPEPIPGKVAVTAFLAGWCSGQNIVFERAQRACAEFGDEVVFRPIRTAERSVFLDWGIGDALFIDGKPVSTGPPPAYAKIKRLIEKRVRRLKRA